jgi:hypothetical protein
VFVFVRRVRFRARAEYGFVGLQIESGMLGTTEERPALSQPPEVHHSVAASQSGGRRCANRPPCVSTEP